MICFALCGSFCTVSSALELIEAMTHSGYDILPVMSEKLYSTDTRFGKASRHIEIIEEICNKEIIHTIEDAEPIGPKLQPDAMIICPCTGNTLAKLANGITDSAVTMAAKAHLRNNRPLVIALATNDALSANLVNIGKLLPRKNIFFVPLVQDDPVKKPSSLIARFDKVAETLENALDGKQIMPLFCKSQ